MQIKRIFENKPPPYFYSDLVWKIGGLFLGRYGIHVHVQCMYGMFLYKSPLKRRTCLDARDRPGSEANNRLVPFGDVAPLGCVSAIASERLMGVWHSLCTAMR